MFTLKENPRGRFLRITEDVAGRRDTIIVPAPGLEEFRRMLEEMARAAGGPSGGGGAAAGPGLVKRGEIGFGCGWFERAPGSGRGESAGL